MAENIFVCKHLKGAGYCTLYKDYCHEGPCGDSTPVEYSPVVHGWWISVDGESECDEYDCSACGQRRTFLEKMSLEDMAEYYPYCPTCGAKMDLKETC